jgi:hypothetical protein
VPHLERDLAVPECNTTMNNGALRISVRSLFNLEIRGTMQQNRYCVALCPSLDTTDPPTGALRRFLWAAILTGFVLLKCGVLAANGG